MARPIPLYLTRDDALAWLGSASQGQQLMLTEMGMFETPEVNTVPLEQCLDLGISQTGYQITDKSYMIHRETVTIYPREVPQRRGGVRFVVDGQLYPETIGLSPGGTYGENMIIAGQMGRTERHIESDELERMVLKALRKHFVKIRSYYVGQQAASMLDSGARLAFSSTSPTEYDLAR